MNYSLVYVTTPTLEEAQKIAKLVVKNRLAACANILPQMMSCYVWEDQFCEEEECVLLLKTHKSKVEDLIMCVKDHHSYDCPCVITLSIDQGNPKFLEWIFKSTCSND